jgi:hypothetical protein
VGETEKTCQPLKDTLDAFVNVTVHSSKVSLPAWLTCETSPAGGGQRQEESVRCRQNQDEKHPNAAARVHPHHHRNDEVCNGLF